MASGAKRSSSEITDDSTADAPGSVTASVAASDERQIDSRHFGASRHGAGGDGDDVRAGVDDGIGGRLAIEVHARRRRAARRPSCQRIHLPKLAFIRSCAATANWPPSACSRSHSWTRWPRSAICPANSVPAGPPPMTSTDRGAAARGGRPSSSRPACGFTPQANGRPSTTRRSMHSWTPMHGRTSGSRASTDFTTSSGSAIVALANPTRSACPSARIRSAVSTLVTRPT